MAKSADVIETEIEKMSIYEKVSLLRKVIAELDISKSGINEHEQFSYLEMKDFVPAIQEECYKLRILTIFDMEEVATLRAINIDDPEEQMVFTLRTELSNSNANPIQNLGAAITYMKRYLFMSLAELVAKDTVDNQANEINSDIKDRMDRLITEMVASIEKMSMDPTTKLKQLGLNATSTLKDIEDAKDILDIEAYKFMEKKREKAEAEANNPNKKAADWLASIK